MNQVIGGTHHSTGPLYSKVNWKSNCAHFLYCLSQRIDLCAVLHKVYSLYTNQNGVTLPELEIKDIHETLNDTEFSKTQFHSILSISLIREFRLLGCLKLWEELEVVLYTLKALCFGSIFSFSKVLRHKLEHCQGGVQLL